jgi:hypothetical protein
MPWSISTSSLEKMMAEQGTDKSGLPVAVAKAVGPERAKIAGDAARVAIGRLDRDNHWTQEPAHVFRASNWRAAKGEVGK